MTVKRIKRPKIMRRRARDVSDKQESIKIIMSDWTPVWVSKTVIAQDKDWNEKLLKSLEGKYRRGQ